jgi:hypothetical protein
MHRRRKNRAIGFLLAKPSPDPLPKGEGIEIENLKMTNGK